MKKERPAWRALFWRRYGKETGRKMSETTMELKYGCNPNQKPARIWMREGGALPLTVLSGKPGYINFLDALNAWQLVKELKEATGLPAAASFKHVSPAGAAVGLPLSDTERKMYFVSAKAQPSPIASAYIRARGADRLCSYGDWAALSDVCDGETARYIKPEVSDGIIAPGYTDEAMEILRTKRKGGYNVVKIDPNYAPEPIERRNIFGITFEQGYNDLTIDETILENIVTQNKDLPQNIKNDMLLALITLKYTQSNSVCYVKNGMTIGVGAGQQSRIHCTRLAGNKADVWWLRQHPKVLSIPFPENVRRPDRDNAIDAFISDVLTPREKEDWVSKLTDVTLGSDAFFPFGDNVERARQSGVKYIAQPGGSIRDDHVIETADKFGMVMAFTGMRLFHH